MQLSISLSSISTAALAEIKVGIILGFTGPIESLTPAMRDGARLAFLEASNSGNLLDGETFTILEADSTCVDSAAATAAAEQLVADGVSAIMGADCSGVWSNQCKRSSTKWYLDGISFCNFTWSK